MKTKRSLELRPRARTTRIRTVRLPKSGRSHRLAPRRAQAARRELPTEIPAIAKPLPQPTPSGAGLSPLTPVASEEPKDAYRLYLREIGQTPLLTPREEIALAKRIRRGDRAAREQMITANLRLVVKIARDYEHLGMPLLDLINEGNIGLMKAVDRFDPRKGAKFSTYGAQWIKQAIRRVLSNQSREIRLPIPILQQISHLGEASARLRGSLGREPSDEELADDLATDVKHVRHWRASAAIKPTSLDTPLNGDDENNRVADVVADEHAATPYDQLEQKTDQALVRRIVAMLNPREQSILRQRFGLDGDEEKTLEQVGEEFGVTRERIRQIQLEALEKLRQELKKLAGMGFAE